MHGCTDDQASKKCKTEGSTIHPPRDGVVSDGDDDEEIVHGGEGDEEHVERVAHTRLEKDDDAETKNERLNCRTILWR